MPLKKGTSGHRTDLLVGSAVGCGGHEEGLAIIGGINDPQRIIGVSDVVNARRERNETHFL